MARLPVRTCGAISLCTPTFLWVWSKSKRKSLSERNASKVSHSSSTTRTPTDRCNLSAYQTRQFTLRRRQHQSPDWRSQMHWQTRTLPTAVCTWHIAWRHRRSKRGGEGGMGSDKKEWWRRRRVNSKGHSVKLFQRGQSDKRDWTCKA